jgi:hypothetical protein
MARRQVAWTVVLDREGAAGTRLWADLDARRVTHSRHRAVISGNQRTRTRRDLYSGGAWRVREDLVGHAAETVRDRAVARTDPN